MRWTYYLKRLVVDHVSFQDMDICETFDGRLKVSGCRSVTNDSEDGRAGLRCLQIIVNDRRGGAYTKSSPADGHIRVRFLERLR